MRFLLTVLSVVLAAPGLQAHGLLIPKDRTVPPLAMLRHEVTVAIEDQAAVTRVEQVFRNHTDRDLEATYVFPVPTGSSVNRFSMWLDGKEVQGTLVDAGSARAAYTEMVRRSYDPGLLEYVGNELFQLKIFPVPRRGDLKVVLSFTAVLSRDAGIIEYRYPLKTDGKATRTLEKFGLQVTIKSQQGVQNIYSPTHAVQVQRRSDREARVTFQEQQALLDKDFQLLFTPGAKDVGMTLLAHRPAGAAKGHFLLLLSPRAELPRDQVQPRDVVLVLDVSGSMAGASIRQAKKALQFVLDRLAPPDRFGVVAFSDVVNAFGGGLWPATPANITRARKWVDARQAVGGTNINDALLAALQRRTKDDARSFTILFFTDGQPTTGVTDPVQIVTNFTNGNTANTRLFTFGVGHDVNAALLDQLALRSRAASVYVRPGEDIEAKVSSLYAKISHPVLVDLKLSAGNEVVMEEMYPPKLPDLFHGGQVIVLGKYSGHGKVKIKLEGRLGGKERVFEYTVEFPENTRDRDMVEAIWARRKIGYLLDQIRDGGEQKELVEAVVALAKQHGIATPYTSYLIAPDAPLPVVGFDQAPGSSRPTAPHKGRPTTPDKGPAGPLGSIPAPGPVGGGFNMVGGMGGMMGMGGGGMMMGGSMMMGGMGMAGGRLGGFGGSVATGTGHLGHGGAAVFNPSVVSPMPASMSVSNWARLVQGRPGAISAKRGQHEDDRLNANGQGTGAGAKAVQKTKDLKSALDQARIALANKQHGQTQIGQIGVDLSVQSNALRGQTRLSWSARRKAAGRTLLEIGGVWIDEGFDPAMPLVTIKAFSPAYFGLLDSKPQLRELFQLGNGLVWVAPAGAALVIDPAHGQEDWKEEILGKLFTKK